MRDIRSLFFLIISRCLAVNHLLAVDDNDAAV